MAGMLLTDNREYLLMLQLLCICYWEVEAEGPDFLALLRRGTARGCPHLELACRLYGCRGPAESSLAQSAETPARE